MFKPDQYIEPNFVRAEPLLPTEREYQSAKVSWSIALLPGRNRKRPIAESVERTW
jgi:hypothetical protein